MKQISPKFDKYPRHFLTTHKIACRNYSRLKEQFDEEEFKKHINKNMEHTFGDYTFIYPESTQDIKDEAIYTYLDLDAGKTETYIFNATVAYTGNFYIPAIHAEAMYDDDLKAVVPGRFVQMIK